MTELIAVLSLVVVYCVGLSVIQLLNLLENDSLLEKIGYSFGIGLGVISCELYVYSRLHVPWNTFVVFTPLLVISLVSLYLTRNRIKKVKPENESQSIFVGVFTILITLQVVYVFLQSQIRPLIAWDGWATWLFRAKIFFIDGMINPYVLRVIDLEYPLFVSLVATYIYLAIGEVNDRVVLLLYPFFYASILLLFYFYLKKQTTKLYALVFTFLLASIQIIIRHSGRFDAGLADLPLSYFILAISISTIKFIDERKLSLLFLTNILLGFVVLIKNEGLPFSIIIQVILLCAIFIQKKYSYLFFSLIWIIPLVDWIVYKNINHLRVTYHFESLSFNYIERFPIIFLKMFHELVNIERWNILWILFVPTIIFHFLYQRNKICSNLVLLIIFLQLTVYVGIFVITPYNINTYIENVLDRLYLHVTPLVVLYISLVFFPIYNDRSKREDHFKLINGSFLGDLLKIKRVSLKDKKKIKNREKIENNKRRK